jgi:DNA invertase Pin-like site-specific DNA recombinase
MRQIRATIDPATRRAPGRTFVSWHPRTWPEIPRGRFCCRFREGVLETLNHLKRLTDYGVAYRSFTEQYFDSCGIFKDAVISILATIAKQERIRLSERTKAGLALARARGKQIGRPRVSVEPFEIVRLRDLGYSLRTIGKRLGISEGSVRGVLRDWHRRTS